MGQVGLKNVHEMVFCLKRAFIYKPLRWKLEIKYYSQHNGTEIIPDDTVVDLIASLVRFSFQCPGNWRCAAV